MTGDREEARLQRELKRLGIDDSEPPEVCPKCGKELEMSSGYVGETVLFCPEHGIVWEDAEGAIRRVF